MTFTHSMCSVWEETHLFQKQYKDLGNVQGETEAKQLKAEILGERGLFPTLEEAGVCSPSAGLWLTHTLCFDSVMVLGKAHRDKDGELGGFMG